MGMLGYTLGQSRGSLVPGSHMKNRSIIDDLTAVVCVSAKPGHLKRGVIIQYTRKIWKNEMISTSSTVPAGCPTSRSRLSDTVSWYQSLLRPVLYIGDVVQSKRMNYFRSSIIWLMVWFTSCNLFISSLELSTKLSNTLHAFNNLAQGVSHEVCVPNSDKGGHIFQTTSPVCSFSTT